MEAEPPAKVSAASELVKIAQEMYAFGVSADGEAFGVPRDVGVPRVVLMLRGGKRSLRAQLAHLYFKRTGRAAGQQALADALLVIEGMAQYAEETDACDPTAVAPRLNLRVARGPNGALWLDLCEPLGRAVLIDAEGWSVVGSEVPVLFKRTALNSPLPDPEPGGKLDDLWGLLNVSAEDRPLVAAWLVAVLWPEIPHPILAISGEQGTGKTTAARIVATLLDPSPVPARKPPRDADSWVTAAAGSWVVSLDNLSDIPPWLADSMCRAVTGDGDVRRKLYTDSEFAVFSFRRCLIINSIDLDADRPDLAERLVPVDLELIDEEHRREEQDLWPRWAEAHPRILGAVLDLAAGVAGVLPTVRLDSKPRMADFARILKAVDVVLGTSGLERYLRKQGALATNSLTGDPFITALAEKITGTAVQTSAGLLALVTPDDPNWHRPKGWPASARSVTSSLKRQAPAMRKAGWLVDNDNGHNHSKVQQWTLRPPTHTEMVGDGYPQHPQHPHAGHAGNAGVQSGQSQDGSSPPPSPQSCRVCGDPLDLTLAADGDTTHPTCEEPT